LKQFLKIEQLVVICRGELHPPRKSQPSATG